jgi:hypothetical protein
MEERILDKPMDIGFQLLGHQECFRCVHGKELQEYHQIKAQGELDQTQK